MLRVTPPEHLNEVVEGIYVFKSGGSKARTLLFNDGYPVVALMQNSSERLSINIEGDTKSVGSAWVCGGVLKNIYCESTLPFDDCLVIRFYPMTFFHLFDINAAHFQKEQIFDFSEIAGHGFEAFMEAYYKASSHEDRIKIAVDFLSAKNTTYSYPEVLRDIQSHIDQQMVGSVKDILDSYSVRLNYKWLERNFKKHLGISPQSYILRRRFLNAYMDLDALSSKDLLKVAIDNGYYDDNHFIKEFRQFSGMPPKAYFNGVINNI